MAEAGERKGKSWFCSPVADSCRSEQQDSGARGFVGGEEGCFRGRDPQLVLILAGSWWWTSLGSHSQELPCCGSRAYGPGLQH